MIYLVTIEPVDNRYTGQWKKWIKQGIERLGAEAEEINGSLRVVEGNNKNFLDPNITNIWKAEQITIMSELFLDDRIKDGDKFVFYDAWHYGAIALEYMSRLNGVEIEIMGFWHAGTYDSYDLTNQVGLKETMQDFETSLFKIYDKSFLATEYHKRIIMNSFNPVDKLKLVDKLKVTGFPYDFSHLDAYKIPIEDKEDLVVFPHRMSSEKQPEILKGMVEELKKRNIEVIFCQEEKLTKDEYHKILARSKVMFSANLQETWGIGTFEAMYLGAVPLVPNRLSYSEMYPNYVYESDISIEDLQKGVIQGIYGYEISMAEVNQTETNPKYNFQKALYRVIEKYCTFDYKNIVE